MSPRHIATHGVAILVGLAAGAFALRDTAAPQPSPPGPAPQHATVATAPAAGTSPATTATTAPDDAPQVPPLPPGELERRYAFVRDLALRGGAFHLGFDDQSYTLSETTSRFLGLTEQQHSAVQGALDTAIDAIRELEAANAETIPESGSIAIGDLSEHVPAIEAQLRAELASALPADDLDLLHRPLAKLFKPLTEVREITIEFHPSSNGYTVRQSVLGPDGKPFNTSSHSRQFPADPSGWRRNSPFLWRFSHLVEPPAPGAGN